MRRTRLLLASGVCGLAGLVIMGLAPPTPDTAPGTDDSPVQSNGQADKTATADHTKFEQLEGPFATGPDVTKACLGCHTEAAKHVMATSHWTWLSTEGQVAELPDGSTRPVGKGNAVVNNFCVAVQSNEPRCTSCHAGYGWKNQEFDFTNETLVDCLVCHDQTGKYKKFPTAAGHPVYETTPQAKREWPPGKGKFWEPAPLVEVAQNVGLPTRRNCGTCHFWGGGGEGVKHGDMDASLLKPHRDLDVHMDVNGANFSCTQCHTTHKHDVAGRYHNKPAYQDRKFVIRGETGEGNLLACESCHTERPHPENKVIDRHADRVSCQACHIPTFAVERPTKMWWDWSQAGKKNDKGKPLVTKVDLKGSKVMSYHGKKGAFVWAKDAVPEYRWFNGQWDQLYLGQPSDLSKTGREQGLVAGKFGEMDIDQPIVQINPLRGSATDPLSRIWPVKVHRGIQPIDAKTNTLLVPKLFGMKPTGAYWKNFDWGLAVAAGMKEAGLEYSGEYGWVQTEMNWPLAHMVRPKEQAVKCVECHTRDPEGRLAGLNGFYLIGRDSYSLLDKIGLAFIGITIIGVALHAFGRVMFTGGKA